ncbi:MAG: hypothetical protein QXT31_07470 [Candidatus Bathyarchaeia archaeon]
MNMNMNKKIALYILFFSIALNISLANAQPTAFIEPFNTPLDPSKWNTFGNGAITIAGGIARIQNGTDGSGNAVPTGILSVKDFATGNFIFSANCLSGLNIWGIINTADNKKQIMFYNLPDSSIYVAIGDGSTWQNQTILLSPPAGYSIYRIVWTLDYVKIYVNDFLLAQSTTVVPKVNMHLIAGAISGSPTATLLLDYITVGSYLAEGTITVTNTLTHTATTIMTTTITNTLTTHATTTEVTTITNTGTSTTYGYTTTLTQTLSETFRTTVDTIFTTITNTYTTRITSTILNYTTIRTVGSTTVNVTRYEINTIFSTLTTTVESLIYSTTWLTATTTPMALGGTLVTAMIGLIIALAAIFLGLRVLRYLKKPPPPKPPEGKPPTGMPPTPPPPIFEIPQIVRPIPKPPTPEKVSEAEVGRKLEEAKKLISAIEKARKVREKEKAKKPSPPSEGGEGGTNA